MAKSRRRGRRPAGAAGRDAPAGSREHWRADGRPKTRYADPGRGQPVVAPAPARGGGRPRSLPVPDLRRVAPRQPPGPTDGTGSDARYTVQTV